MRPSIPVSASRNSRTGTEFMCSKKSRKCCLSGDV